MKKNAWTMAELVVVIIAIILLSTIAMKTFKPNMNKNRIFVYATIKNLEKGNAVILDKRETLELDRPTGGKDLYCLELADAFNLPATANCVVQSADNTTVNMTFPSGVTIMGLAGPWRTPSSTLGLNFVYKNILIDLDGSKGKNTIGIDRFPFRIVYGDDFPGVLIPSSGSTLYYNYEGTASAALTTPFSGTGSTTNYLNNKEILSYDIYRINDSEAESTTASIVASNLSIMQADCGAHGGNGYFSKKMCSLNDARVIAKCASSSTCFECQKTGTASWNICPNKKADGSSYSTTTQTGCETVSKETSANPNELSCFIMLHKPSGGSFLVGTLMDGMDQL